MKQIYCISDDLFMAFAFMSFIVAVVCRLLGISAIIWGITPNQLFQGAIVCLLFSIALSLRDMSQIARK